MSHSKLSIPALRWGLGARKAFPQMEVSSGKCELVSLCELISNLKCENEAKHRKTNIKGNGTAKLTKLTLEPQKARSYWPCFDVSLSQEAHTLSSHSSPFLLQEG